MTGTFRIVVPLGLPEVIRVGLLTATIATARELRIEELERPEPLDHLQEPFDLLFHFGEAPPRPGWVSRLVGRAPLVPLASEAYLAELGRPRSPDELVEHRVLAWRVGRAIPTQWPLRAGGFVDVEPVFCSRNGLLMHRLAEEGIGILLGDPNPRVRTAPRPLVPVLDDQIGCFVTLYCLLPADERLSPRQRVILDAILGALEGLRRRD